MNTPLPTRPVCLPLARLAPGMRVARAILRGDGAVLLPADSVLDQDALAQLHQRGIEVVVVAQPDTRTPQMCAAEEAATRTRIEQIFRPVEGDGEARAELKRAVLAYRLGSAG